MPAGRYRRRPATAGRSKAERQWAESLRMPYARFRHAMRNVRKKCFRMSRTKAGFRSQSRGNAKGDRNAIVAGRKQWAVDNKDIMMTMRAKE